MDYLTRRFVRPVQDYDKSKEKVRGNKRTACNSMNYSSSDEDVNDHDSSSTKSTTKKLTSKSTRRNTKGKKSSANKKQRVHTNDKDKGRSKKKDENKTESRRRFKKKCKDHRAFVTTSYKNSQFLEGQKDDFDALLGIRGKYANHMPASDLRLRGVMGRRLIDEIFQLWLRANGDPRLRVYLITFLDDTFLVNERGGEAEPKKCMDKVQAVIRQYTSFNAIGIIENQAMVNYPKGKVGKMLSIHAHVICWGYYPEDCQRLKAQAKGFRTALTKIPVHIAPIKTTEGDFTTVARYLAKPPSEGKNVIYKKLAAGKACLKSVTHGMKKYHHRRLFEYCSKIPMEHTIFGVREGAVIRRKIVTQMNKWQKTRKGTQVQLGGRVDQLFEEFLRNNKKLKNYEPMKVIYRRSNHSE